MTDNKDNSKKKKTLSLKLGSKPLIAPNKNIEVGKTVIVEKKRYKRNTNSDIHQKKNTSLKSTTIDNKTSEDVKTIPSTKKSGVLLKPLSKDEQKRILNADSKKDKNSEIEKIRSKDSSKLEPSETKLANDNENINFENIDNKKDFDKKKIN